MEAIVSALNIFFMVLTYALFARIILSWIPVFHGTRFMELLLMVTEPILAPIRGVIQRSPLGGPGMVLDFSPIIAFFLLNFLQNFINRVL